MNSYAMTEVMVYKHDSESERILWSIGESRHNSKKDTVTALRQFKREHSQKTLLIYKNTDLELQPWLIKNLDFLKIKYQVIEVSEEQTKELSSELYSLFEEKQRHRARGLVNDVKHWWTSAYEAPTKTEISHGYVMGSIKGSLAAPFWFASGVSPEVATLLTIGVALNELMQTRYMRTLDNIYLKRTNTDPDFTINRSFIGNLILRSAVSLAFSYLWRSISGPVGAAHSVRSLQGNAELWANMIAKLPGAWLGSVKATRLSRNASSWIGFLVFGVYASILNNADITGIKLQSLMHIPAIKLGELTIYEPSTTLVILFGSILATTVAIKYGPAHKISNVLEAFDRTSKKIILKTKLNFDSILSELSAPKTNRLPASCSSILI